MALAGACGPGPALDSGLGTGSLSEPDGTLASGGAKGIAGVGLRVAMDVAERREGSSVGRRASRLAKGDGGWAEEENASDIAPRGPRGGMANVSCNEGAPRKRIAGGANMSDVGKGMSESEEEKEWLGSGPGSDESGPGSKDVGGSVDGTAGGSSICVEGLRVWSFRSANSAPPKNEVGAKAEDSELAAMSTELSGLLGSKKNAPRSEFWLSASVFSSTVSWLEDSGIGPSGPSMAGGLVPDPAGAFLFASGEDACNGLARGMSDTFKLEPCGAAWEARAGGYGGCAIFGRSGRAERVGSRICGMRVPLEV